MIEPSTPINSMRLHSFLKLLCLCLCFFVFAVGCGNDEPQSPQEPQEIDPEAIIETTEIQKAHAHCFSQGFKPMIEYTEASGNVLYCVFTESQKRCPAIDFLYGDCSVRTATNFDSGFSTSTAQVDDVFSGPRFCEPVAKPVCGENGRTYTNACIAEQQGITVIANGTCAANIERGNPAVVEKQNTNSNDSGASSSGSSNIGNNGNSSFDPNNTGSSADNAEPLLPPNTPQEPIISDAGLPDWVTVPFSLITQDITVIRTEVYKCQVGSSTYYLQTEQRSELFSTLYENDGDLLCNPTHDIANQCPSAFANGAIPSSCQLVLAKGKE